MQCRLNQSQELPAKEHYLSLSTSTGTNLGASSPILHHLLYTILPYFRGFWYMESSRICIIKALSPGRGPPLPPPPLSFPSLLKPQVRAAAQLAPPDTGTEVGLKSWSSSASKQLLDPGTQHHTHRLSIRSKTRKPFPQVSGGCLVPPAEPFASSNQERLSFDPDLGNLRHVQGRAYVDHDDGFHHLQPVSRPPSVVFL